MSSNLENLYRQVIMDHYKNPRNKGLVTDTNYLTSRLNNPSCGDDLTVQVLIENDMIIDVKHEGTGCSICCSSASVMSENLKGKTLEEVRKISQNFYDMLMGSEEFNEDMDMGDAIAYVGVKNFPARIKCATLSYKAIEKLLNENTK